jgi:curli biogenesis system outer membrane secretion channel CsgG
MAIHQGAVMNNIKKVAVAALAVAALAGCATTRTADLAGANAMPAKEYQVSRPAPSYGSMGGYRYRRFVAVSASAS